MSSNNFATMLPEKNSKDRLAELLADLQAFVILPDKNNQLCVNHESIDTLLRSFSFILPDDALIYFQWCNQIRLRSVDQQLFPSGGLLYLKNAFQHYHDLLSLNFLDGNINQFSTQTNENNSPFTFWQPQWLPIFEDGSGGFYVVLCGQQPAISSPVYFVVTGDALATYLAYDSLSSLVYTVLVAYKSGILSVDKAGYLQANRLSFIHLINDANPYRKQHLYQSAGDARTIADLVQKLASPDSQLQTKAYQALIHLADSTAVPLLIQQLQHENTEVRRLAVIILGESGDVRAVDKLLPLLEDEYPSVQHASANALGKLKDAKASKALLAHLHASDSTLRSSIIMALGSIRAVDAINPLIDLLESDHLDDRENAVTALGEIGDPKVVDALMRMLSSDEGHIRLRAIDSLGRIALCD